jgi:hypothetical protein
MLKTINSPGDLRKLPRAELKPLADELRQFVLDSVAKTGGHLSSNLGTVELTIALHYVFNTPEDRIVWAACASRTAFPVFRAARRANTTHSAPPIHRPRSRPRSAWRWRPGPKAKAGMRSPSSATVL